MGRDGLDDAVCVDPSVEDTGDVKCVVVVELGGDVAGQEIRLGGIGQGDGVSDDPSVLLEPVGVSIPRRQLCHSISFTAKQGSDDSRGVVQAARPSRWTSSLSEREQIRLIPYL